MKYSLLLVTLFSVSVLLGVELAKEVDIEEITPIEVIPAKTTHVVVTPTKKVEKVVEKNSTVRVNVIGQGVAPSFARSPAQSYALAKRAAIADAYRILAERIKGVKVEGKDTIKNMSIKSSVVNTKVEAMLKNAKVVETKFKDGLCEVEMEISINHNNF
jgi:hypothetical protein